MRLTLKSLQAEMRNSFDDINERADRILLRLDTHIKETDSNFRRVDQRFDEMGRKFGEMDRKFGEMDRKFDKLIGDISTSLMPYFSSMDEMLSNHEDRITTLEKRH